MDVLDAKSISRKKGLTISFSSFFMLGLAWLMITNAGLISPLFLPSPRSILLAAGELFREGIIFDIWASLYRVLLGFSISVAAAVPIGLAISINSKARAILLPLTNYFRYIPPSALVPLLILWLGVGEAEKIAVISISIAPYLSLLVADVVKNIRPEYFEAAQIMGINQRLLLTKIITPASLPGLWDALRIMFGAAWSYIIFAEMIAANQGLGHLIIQSQRYLQTPKVMVGIMVIGMLGLVTDHLFVVGYKKFFPWTNK